MQIRKKIPGQQLKLPDCKYVLIDTDAGGDDAQTIILAINEAKRTGKIIVGITCVDGNAFIKDVAINVAITVSLCETDIPIYLGKIEIIQVLSKVLWALITKTTILVKTGWEENSSNTYKSSRPRENIASISFKKQMELILSYNALTNMPMTLPLLRWPL